MSRHVDNNIRIWALLTSFSEPPPRPAMLALKPSLLLATLTLSSAVAALPDLGQIRIGGGEVHTTNSWKWFDYGAL